MVYFEINMTPSPINLFCQGLVTLLTTRETLLRLNKMSNVKQFNDNHRRKLQSKNLSKCFTVSLNMYIYIFIYMKDQSKAAIILFIKFLH